MKLATWNVNSIRARHDRLLAWLAAERPDIVCLQETKTEDDKLPLLELRAAGYHVAHAGQRTYNGVAILSREPLVEVARGLGDDVEDPQARLIAATTGGLRVVSVYVPNGQAVGTDKFAYKLAWLARLRAYLARHHQVSQRLVVCGDFNVAPDERDVHDPALWAKETLFHPAVRSAFDAVRDFGLRDVFRAHDETAGVYSWWDYRAGAFHKNQGLRIDHVLATPAVVTTGARIDRDMRKGVTPSDHAPVIATLA